MLPSYGSAPTVPFYQESVIRRLARGVSVRTIWVGRVRLSLGQHAVRWIRLSYGTAKKTGTSREWLLCSLRCVVGPPSRRSCLPTFRIRPRIWGIYISLPIVPTDQKELNSRARVCERRGLSAGCHNAELFSMCVFNSAENYFQVPPSWAQYEVLALLVLPTIFIMLYYSALLPRAPPTTRRMCGPSL